LVSGYEAATSDIIWTIDSNIRIGPYAAHRSVAALLSKQSDGKRVGLVHHLPTARLANNGDDASLGSMLELHFLNCVHAKMYLAINWARVASCLIGKSNMFRKSDAGSIRDYGAYMSEDNAIGKRIWLTGGHYMTRDLAWQELGNPSVSDYFARRARYTAHSYF
jgi:ceramide glucosyltransferase